MKNVLRISLMAILFIGLSFTSNAQNKHEQRMEKKFEKLAERLELTDNESKEVKSILKSHLEEQRAAHETMKAKRPSKAQMKNLSDSEIEALIESRFAAEEAHLASKKRLHAKLKSVLPMKKVAKIHLALERQKRKGRKGHRGHHHRGHREHNGDGKDCKEPNPER